MLLILLSMHSIGECIWFATRAPQAAQTTVNFPNFMVIEILSCRKLDTVKTGLPDSNESDSMRITWGPTRGASGH